MTHPPFAVNRLILDVIRLSCFARNPFGFPPIGFDPGRKRMT